MEVYNFFTVPSTVHVASNETCVGIISKCLGPFGLICWPAKPVGNHTCALCGYVNSVVDLTLRGGERFTNAAPDLNQNPRDVFAVEI